MGEPPSPVNSLHSRWHLNPLGAHPMTDSGNTVRPSRKRRAPLEKFASGQSSSSPPQCRRTKNALPSAESTATANVFRKNRQDYLDIILDG